MKHCTWCVCAVAWVSADPGATGVFSEGRAGKCEDAQQSNKAVENAQDCMDACSKDALSARNSATNGCLHAAFSSSTKNCIFYGGQCQKLHHDVDYKTYSSKNDEDIENFILSLPEGTQAQAMATKHPTPTLQPVLLGRAKFTEVSAANTTETYRTPKLTELHDAATIQPVLPGRPSVATFSAADKADMALTPLQRRAAVEIDMVEAEENDIFKFAKLEASLINLTKARIKISQRPMNGKRPASQHTEKDSKPDLK
jgi:hypothetical protein